MKKMKKYFVSALVIGCCMTAIGGGISIKAHADSSEQLSVLTQDNYSVSFASIRYTTATDSNSGIRFSIRMDKAAYEAVTAIDGVTLGAKLLPADLVTDKLDVNTASAQTAITYGVGVDEEKPSEVASIWGAAADDATKMEAIVYMYDIDLNSYNRDITIVAYATVGEEEFYTKQVSESVAEVAVKLLEADKTAEDSEKLTEEQKAELEGFLNEYQINFYDEDGTTVLYSDTHTYGDVVNLPTISGYNIVSWYAYNGIDYEAEAITLGSNITVKGNMQYKVAEKYAPMYEAVSNTTVERVTDADYLYGGQEYVYKATYNAAQWDGSASIKLTSAAPTAPAGTGMVEIWVRCTAQGYSYNTITCGDKTVGNPYDAWGCFSFTVEEYNALIANGTEFVFADTSGGNQGKPLYFSQPIFVESDYTAVSNTTVTKVTTEENYTVGDVTFSNMHPGQSVVYVATYNGDASKDDESAAKFKLTGATPAPAGTTNVTIGVRGTVACYGGNAITDGTNTVGISPSLWQYFSYTVDEYNEMIENGTAFAFGDYQGNGKYGVLLISEPIFESYSYQAVSNTTVEKVTDAGYVYGDQDYVYKTYYNAVQWDGSASIKLTSAAPKAPAGTSAVKIWVRCTSEGYSYNTITCAGKTVGNPFVEWGCFTFTVDEYNALINEGIEFVFADMSGSNQAKPLYFSEPVFIMDEYAAVSNTTVTKVTTEENYTVGDVTFSNMHPGQSVVYVATYNGDASKDDASAAKFKLMGITAAPAGTTNVLIGVRGTAACYGGNAITDGINTVGISPSLWQYFSYTIDEYNEMVANGAVFSFGDNQGNGKYGVLLISEPIFSNATSPWTAVNGTVAIDYGTVYGDELYSIKYNAASWIGEFSLNANAPEAPDGATKVTFYVKTTGESGAHSFGVGDQNQYGGTQLTQNEWTKVEMSVEEYNSYKANGTVLHVTNGNNVVWNTYWISNIVFSQPVFIMDEYAAVSNTTVEKVTDAGYLYGDQEYVYKATYNAAQWDGSASIKLTSAAPQAPEGTTSVEIWVRCTAQGYSYNTITCGDKTVGNPYDAWGCFSFTVEEYNALIANGTEFVFADKSGGNQGKPLYFSQPIFVASDYAAVSNTTVTKVTTEENYTVGDVTFSNMHPGQSVVYVATYNGDASKDDESAAKFKLASAISAPEGTINVVIGVRGTAACYGGNAITDGTKTVGISPSYWQYFIYSVEEYNALIANGAVFSFGDNQGNGKYGVLLISQPIFSNATSPWTAVNGTVAIDYGNVYGDELYSFKYNAGGWIGEFSLNANAPEAPDGATKVTFYVKTTGESGAHSFGVGDQNQYGGTQLTQNEWTKVEMSVEEYNSYKANGTVLHVTNGNDVYWFTYWISNIIFS